MKFDRNHIIIENDLHDLASDRLKNYVAHVLCYEGECEFTFNLGRFHLHGHDSMIVREGRMVEDIVTSDDFQVKVIYVKDHFIEMATPPEQLWHAGHPVALSEPCNAAHRQPFCHLKTGL